MILEYAKKQYPGYTDEEALKAYVLAKDSELDTDVQNRLYGTSNKIGGKRKAGYQILRDFFDGDQWFQGKEGGASTNVVNFCRMTVNNYTAFLTQDEPEIDIPPRDPLDDVEVARVKEHENLIREILDDNKWYNIFFEGVQNGSLLGDTMIVGPFYDKKRGKIWLRNVKRPEFIRIIWESEDYDRVIGFIYHYYTAVEKANDMFRAELNEKGIADLRTYISQTTPVPSSSQSSQEETQRVLVLEFWDEKHKLVLLNNIAISFDTHDLGFIPLHYVRNIPHPVDPWGVSDIEDLLDPQLQYNEQDSAMQDILRQVAFASIFGKNLSVEEIQAGVAKVYDLGEEAEVFQDPRNTNFPFLQTYLTDKKQNVDVASGIPDVFQGGKGVRDVSGRALSVLMTPVNNRVRGKEKRWGLVIKDIVKDINLLLEKYVPGGRDLIQGWHKTEVFFPGTLVRDVTDELNKMIQKVQSQYTTMKNIGIASPKDEQALMKKELADMDLALELSKVPQLRMALAQQAIAQAQAKLQAGQANEMGGPPTLSEDQNQGGANPISARGNNVGSGTTPEGVLNTGAANAGTPMMPNQ